MRFDFEGKTFRVVRNDGPGAEVNEATVFHFSQQGDIVHADYFGGGVRVGKLVGVLAGATMRHRYVQVNGEGEFSAGQSTDEVELTPEGKIRLIDSWAWEDGRGRGLCVFEEI